MAKDRDDGATLVRIPRGERRALHGLAEFVGLDGDGACLLKTWPLPASVKIRRKRRDVDKFEPRGDISD